ncbi:MAG: L-histidine N(alpha)-methyltransferase [Flavobacteriaceae bacterium]|nr:L-histidine N(alpha)-methyltransferase [Flavobacteriaceae bacterium]
MNTIFAQDIIDGLTSEEKHLSSKYFYDDTGSRIFQEIMAMPEYYLTNSEYEILSMQTSKIVDALAFNKPFNIIELGAGDGIKTFNLLEYLTQKKIDFTYVPIDISEEAIEMLLDKLNEKLPSLKVAPKVGDYFTILKENFTNTSTPNLLLFLGSNIGNYPHDNALELIKLFNQSINVGDKLLIGIDLKKNPNTIHQAYFDPHGITKRFNLNLLQRINREFDANFNINHFDFYCYYNPQNGEVRSYIISLKKQLIHIKKLDLQIEFDYDELIWTELSKKYDLNGINQLAHDTGFKVLDHFLDCKHYFTDSLWKK